MPLTLDIVRHGDAVAHHPDGDAARPLAPRGRAAVQRLADTLRAEGWSPDRIIASPYVRAQETAAILAGVARRPVDTWRVLEPETPPQRVLDALIAEDPAAGAHIVLVAHLPLVERLHLLLAGGDVPWTPGTLARLALPHDLAGRGRLTRVWTP